MQFGDFHLFFNTLNKQVIVNAGFRWIKTLSLSFGIGDLLLLRDMDHQHPCLPLPQ